MKFASMYSRALVNLLFKEVEMSVIQFCNQFFVSVDPSTSAYEIAKKMKRKRVGEVVVEDLNGTKSKPMGIITDRDLVVQALAEDIDLNEVLAKDMISRSPVTVKDDCGLYEAIELMQKEGVRRLIVADEYGFTSGVISADLILQLLGDELSRLGCLFKGQFEKEKFSFSGVQSSQQHLAI
jgi:predicted transcriptional regulator